MCEMTDQDRIQLLIFAIEAAIYGYANLNSYVYDESNSQMNKKEI